MAESSKVKSGTKSATTTKKVTKKTKKEEVLETTASDKETKDGTIQESNSAKAQATEEPAEEVKDAKPEVKSQSTAKAGKRSAKAIAEVEEKQAKEERKAAKKAADSEDAPKPKHVQKVRSKLERRAKGFRKSAELIEAGKIYSLADAIELAVKTSHVKFDATVELHLRLSVDPRQADQNIRDIVVLPAGTGKKVRVAVFADTEGVAAAKKAGADIAGEDEFLQQLDKGVIDFDVLIATPASMAKLGKYARVLGPKGLMPNPKSGTVTADVAKGVSDAKAGRVEYRVDSTGIVHLGVGKVSFGKDKLLDNTRAVFASIKGNKPSSIKSAYVKSIYVTTSMGPSIAVEASEL
jgi:large subunit ribosomal protein L1